MSSREVVDQRGGTSAATSFLRSLHPRSELKSPPSVSRWWVKSGIVGRMSDGCWVKAGVGELDELMMDEGKGREWMSGWWMRQIRESGGPLWWPSTPTAFLYHEQLYDAMLHLACCLLSDWAVLTARLATQLFRWSCREALNTGGAGFCMEALNTSGAGHDGKLATLIVVELELLVKLSTLLST